MKRKIAAALFAAVVLTSQFGAAFAEDKGPWTTDHPYAWGVGSFPFRMVTGVVGGGMGAVAGSAKGIVETEKKFSENTFAQANKNPLMIPVGLVGAVVAVPVGVITGAPSGAFTAAKTGFTWWDRY